MFTIIMSSPRTRSAVALPSSVWRRHTNPGEASASALIGSSCSTKPASWGDSSGASTRATFIWASHQSAIPSLLVGGPDQHLVDGNSSGPGHDVDHGVGDVVGVKALYRCEPLT